uniref:Glycosyltransferase n=1 Tax=Gynostemma pentaphyllum TaxID=182084 RepID=A0A8F2F5K2_GYNPE|nr:UGT73B4 [Gynostemma pentaphyllum]
MASPHIVIFPFMAHGHTIPLVDLSKVLSRQQIKVTIITTPSNAKTIAPTIDGFRHISLVQLPFTSIDGLPEGCDCEHTSQLPSMDFFFPFVIATKRFQKPFEQVLQSMKNSDDLPICVISDFFLTWTLGICQRFGVLRLVFHGMGVLPLLISKTLWTNKLQSKSKSSSVSDHLNLLGNLPFNLTIDDLPEDLKITDNNNIVSKLTAEILESEMQSWGVIVNSFRELESDYIAQFDSFGPKAWCIGPIFLNGQMEISNEKTSNGEDEPSTMVMKWLDMQAIERPESVIYVSFGTQADVSDELLEEVALGLEDSGYPFLLVIQSNTWPASSEIEKRVKPRCLITREFINQRQILFHKAIGGFLSHCGWNSVLESMAASIPILAWPLMMDQKLNARYLIDGLGFGIGIEKEKIKGSGEAISRREISAGVKELMNGEKGRKARDRASELGQLAKGAVENGGSSNETLKNLLRKLSISAESV